MARPKLFHSVKVLDGDPQMMDLFDRDPDGLIKTQNMVMDPVKDMHEIEFWEDKLTKNKIPYLLTEVEMTLSNPVRYSKGYVLFTQNGSIG